MKMELGYLLDLLVENDNLAEIKAVEALNEIHFSYYLITISFFNPPENESLRRV
jgi:hypothetical protein